jgi:hypothetical protein
MVDAFSSDPASEETRRGSMNAEHVIDFIRVALGRVDQLYYASRPYHEDMLRRIGIRRDHPHRRALTSFLTRHGERVFCYELYHQIRVLIEDYYREHPEERDQDRQEHFYLQAELKKEQIGDLRDLFEGEIAQLEKEYIPDFLLHGTGHFERQDLIIEVKSNPRLPVADLQYDIQKLQEFITRYRYRYGLFLLNVKYFCRQRSSNLPVSASRFRW